MYNPQNAKEQPSLPSDAIFEGAVISIEDGVVGSFVKDMSKWKKTDKDDKAIKVTMEVMHGNISYKFDQIFTYFEENGTTIYNPKSNLGKYHKKYGSLPKVGDKIKAVANADGFLRLRLE